MAKIGRPTLGFTEVVNTESMGVILGLDEKRIRQLAQKNLIPRHTDNDGNVVEGRWYVPAVVQSYLKYKTDAHKSTKASTDLDAAKLRKLNAQAEQEELRTDLMKGRVIRCQDAERVWGDMASACRSKLLSMPTKLARTLLAQKDLVFIATTIEEAIYEALNELKDFDVEDIQADNPEFVLIDGEQNEEDADDTTEDD